MARKKKSVETFDSIAMQELSDEQRNELVEQEDKENMENEEVSPEEELQDQASQEAETAQAMDEPEVPSEEESEGASKPEEINAPLPNDIKPGVTGGTGENSMDMAPAEGAGVSEGSPTTEPQPDGYVAQEGEFVKSSDSGDFEKNNQTVPDEVSGSYTYTANEDQDVSYSDEGDALPTASRDLQPGITPGTGGF